MQDDSPDDGALFRGTARADLAELRRQHEAHSERLVELEREAAEQRALLARIDGQMVFLSAAHERSAQLAAVQAQLAAAQAQADSMVRTTQQIATIKGDGERVKFRYQLILRVVALIVAVAPAAIALLHAAKC